MLIALLACALVIVAYDAALGVREFTCLQRGDLPLERLLRVWALRLFLLYGLGAIALLALLGRLQAITALPPEFTARVASSENVSDNFVLIVVGAMVIGASVSMLVVTAIQRRRRASTPPTPSALAPQSNRGRLWAIVVSVNAGVCEELFFRLALPLLLVMLLGNDVLGCVIAAVLFGTMHAYQGWKGVVATTFVGAAFTLLYRVTGSLWLVIALHTAIDLNALLLQPWLQRRMARVS